MGFSALQVPRRRAQLTGNFQVKKTASTAIVAACLMTLIGTSSATAAQRLSGDQIRALFRGVINGLYKNETVVKAKATRNGDLIAWFEGKVDTGTWKVVNNQVCVAFKVWTSGKFKCRFVERQGNWYLAVNNKGKSKFRFQK